jgi:phosphoglycolate phosphatase
LSVKAVVFDLDGTLANFNLDYKNVRAEVRGYLINVGVPASVLSTNDSIFDMLNKTEIFLKNSGKNHRLVEQTREGAFAIAEKYELDAAKSTGLLPGVIECLRTLKKLGIKIGLFTINSEKSVNYILDRFNIRDFFDVVIPRNRVEYVKPHPEHLGAVLKSLNINSRNTMVVGDSITDMRSANELKAIAVGLPTGISTVDQLMSNGADYIITSIIDLPVLVDKENKRSGQSKKESK